MHCNILRCFLEQFGHLGLRQPDSLVFQADINLRLPVFALVYDDQGGLLRRAEDANVGRDVALRFKDGRVGAKVTGKEIHDFIVKVKEKYNSIILTANSIGAFFSMNSGIDTMIEKAYFISPVVDMERLITDMMNWANVTEDELEEKKIIRISSGEELSWEYLSYVRRHPVSWTTPTAILYGSKDNITSYDTIVSFAEKHNASLTVMENGEHWFHTDEQMRFLDDWIQK